MVRIPSYLQLNRYGIYHFRIRLSRPLVVQLGRTEFNRSLRTSNRRKAIHLAQGIKFKLDKVFRTILDSNMNWKQSRQLLDRVAGDIIQRFKDSVDEEGPEAIGMQLTNLELERTAEFFADLKFFGETDYEGFDEKGNKVLIPFNGISEVPEIKGFADWVKRKYEIDIPKKDNEEFCYEVAKILKRLMQMKLDLMSELEELEYGVPVKQEQTVPKNHQSPILLRDVFTKLYHEKTALEGSWSENTALQRKETFNRIHEIFEYLLDRLIYNFCSSSQCFACGFLQPIPHDINLAVRLAVPLVGPAEDFHLQVVRLVTTTNRTVPVTALRAMPGTPNKKKRSNRSAFFIFSALKPEFIFHHLQPVNQD